MDIKLQKANREDMHVLWKMQVEAFKGLLEKYQDYDMSPAAESYERILQKYDFTGTTYFFIVADGTKVGGIRVIDKQDGSRKRISPIWIMPEFRNQGYAQQAIIEAEKIYGDDDTVIGYTVDGAVGDMIAGSLSRDAGENVGTYAIRMGSLAPLNPNINLTLNSAMSIWAQVPALTFPMPHWTMTASHPPSLPT